MKSLLITGASGYVGRDLVSKVSKLNKYDISVLLRNRDNATPKEIRQIIINDFTKIENSFFSKLGTPDLIVHLAGIAHKKNIKNDDFISINVDVTSKLYNWAVEVNAEKVYFLSSIGVNGQVSVSPLDEMSNLILKNSMQKANCVLKKQLPLIKITTTKQNMSLLEVL